MKERRIKLMSGKAEGWRPRVRKKRRSGRMKEWRNESVKEWMIGEAEVVRN